MKKNQVGDKENKLVMVIVRSADILNRYLQIELAKFNSSPTRFAIMNALLVHGGSMTPTAISKWMFRAKHSVTGILKVLGERVSCDVNLMQPMAVPLISLSRRKVGNRPGKCYLYPIKLAKRSSPASMIRSWKY